MKRGRKGYAEIRPLVVFLAQKIRAERLMASRHRSLREIAFLLAKAGHGTKATQVTTGPATSGDIPGPTAPRPFRRCSLQSSVSIAMILIGLNAFGSGVGPKSSLVSASAPQLAR